MIKTTLLAALSLTTVGYSADCANVFGALQGLQHALSELQRDPRLAVSAPLPKAPLDPTNIGVVASEAPHLALGLALHAPEYAAPTQQQLVNEAFKNSAALGDVAAMAALFAQVVKPSQATLNGVFTTAIEGYRDPLLQRQSYDLIQHVFTTPELATVRPTEAVANQILGLAMDRGDTPVVGIMFRFLVPNPRELDECSRPAALITVAEKGHTNIVLAYLNPDISGFEVDQAGVNAALGLAAYNGQREVVLAMLDPYRNKGVQPDRCGVNRALWNAALNNHSDIVLLMLNTETNKGAQPDQHGVNKALWNAATYGHRDLVEILVGKADKAGIKGGLSLTDLTPEIRKLLEAEGAKMTGGGTAGTASGPRS